MWLFRYNGTCESWRWVVSSDQLHTWHIILCTSRCVTFYIYIYIDCFLVELLAWKVWDSCLSSYAFKKKRAEMGDFVHFINTHVMSLMSWMNYDLIVFWCSTVEMKNGKEKEEENTNLFHFFLNISNNR